MDKKEVLKILKDNIQSALGCTEPAALAYAASLAGEKISGEIKSIEVLVDNSFYKNCLRVTIPKTNLKGLDYAVALGVIGGKPQYKLNVLRDISESDVAKAIEIARSSIIKINVRKCPGFYISVYIEADNGSGCCTIMGNHTNVVRLEHNGETMICGPAITGSCDIDAVHGLDLVSILKFVHEIDVEDLIFLKDSWEINMRIAREGLKENGKGYFGIALQKIYNDLEVNLPATNTCLSARIKAFTAAACDARMDGLNYPVVAIAGSGNQGIAAVVPVAVYSEMKSIPPKRVLRAIALSALVTIYIKSKIGTLTPICGCAIAASAGSSASMAYLLGGGDLDIYSAIINVIGGLTGMICDGAKGSCALKLAIAASTAFDAAHLAIQGVVIQSADGIIGNDAENTISNVRYLVNSGMKHVDEAIVCIIKQQLKGLK